MNKFFFAAASILALGVFGCAAETSTSEAEATAESLKSSAPVVGEFAHCGGNIKNAPVCATGFKCQLDVARPDTGGICVNKGVGAHCGGNIQNPPKCNAGLECVLSISHPDTGGTCNYASYGESCGGNTAHAVECGFGLECSHVAADGSFINPDFPGVCLEGVGQHCGGNIANPKVCAGGLTCKGGTRVGDIGGTCQ